MITSEIEQIFRKFHQKDIKTKKDIMLDCHFEQLLSKEDLTRTINPDLLCTSESKEYFPIHKKLLILCFYEMSNHCRLDSAQWLNLRLKWGNRIPNLWYQYDEFPEFWFFHRNKERTPLYTHPNIEDEIKKREYNDPIDYRRITNMCVHYTHRTENSMVKLRNRPIICPGVTKNMHVPFHKREYIDGDFEVSLSKGNKRAERYATKASIHLMRNKCQVCCMKYLY